MAGLLQQLSFSNESRTPDGLTPAEVLAQISHTAHAAIERGTHLGLQEHNGDFVFSSSAVPENHGAGAEIENDDPYLHEWYTINASDEYLAVQAALREERRAELKNFAKKKTEDKAAEDDE